MTNSVYVFDLDDTLVESYRRYECGLLKVLDDAGIAYDAKAMSATINPLGIEGTAAYYATLGVPGSVEEIIEVMMSKMDVFYTQDVKPAPGAAAYIHRLHGEGARLFVLTATAHRVADACLKANGLFDFFEQVWCVDDFGYTKRQEKLFETVTEAIGCQPADVVFYDDGVAAIRTARAFGWHTVGVLSPHAVESAGMAEAAHECIVDFREL